MRFSSCSVSQLSSLSGCSCPCVLSVSSSACSRKAALSPRSSVSTAATTRKRKRDEFEAAQREGKEAPQGHGRGSVPNVPASQGGEDEEEEDEEWAEARQYNGRGGGSS